MKTRAASRLVGITVIAVSLAAGSLVAEAGPDSTMDSYTKARSVVDSAVEAAGGADLLNGISTVEWNQSGTTWARNQSPKVEAPFQANQQSGRVVLDLERGWLLFETGGQFPGGVFRNRTVIAGDDKFVLNMTAKTVQHNPNLDFANFAFFQRLFPPLMLRKALQQANSLRWLGTTMIDDRPQDIVTFAWDNGLTPTVYIDSESHLVSKYELLFPDNLTGDAVSELDFPSYAEVAGIQAPGGYHQTIGGTLAAKIEYSDIVINGTVSEDEFTVPFGFREIAPPATGDVRVVELADDVYMVEGLANFGYNFYFVLFDEFILAFDAAVSRGVSAQAIAKMKEAAPGKPIRYVVVSHHHDDHAGGVRAFIDEGATVITTEANQAYLEEMAASVSSLAGEGTDSMADPVFEFVDGRHVIEAAGNQAVIYDIGPNPHAEEMLVLYLPKQKILFEADLISPPRSGQAGPASDAGAHFAETVEKLGLEVDQLGGVHGTVGTWADVEDAMRRRSAL